MKQLYYLKYKKLTTWYDPHAVFVSLYKNEKHSFWLERKTQTEHFTYLGSASDVIEYTLQTNETIITNQTKKRIIKQDIFKLLDNELQTRTIHQAANIPFDFTGGFIGYFGYELKTLSGGKTNPHSSYPDSLWFFVKDFLVFDHKEQCIYLAYLRTENEKQASWFNEIEKQLEKNEIKKEQKKTSSEAINFIPTLPREKYLQAIATAKDYLRKGESYEICLTNTFSTKADVDPFDLFANVRKNNPSPYLTYIKHHDLAIICSTPEQFLTINKEREIISKPIKGTISRRKNTEEDEEQKRILQTSEKDLAENLMITDLLRNDLGRICEIGSVSVSKLQAIETYQTVHQMVSTVKGNLRQNVSVIESIRTCFPGGSMTGAPKIRTMEILDKLEPTPRGIYSGAIGYIGLDQTVSLNIVIRTIVMQKNKLTIGAGGAILYQSDPQSEYEEMLLKARILMQTIAQTADFKIADGTKHTVFIALGSNVGEKEGNINNAVTKLKEKITDIKVAKFYESKPMYYEKQDDFINTVLAGKTKLSPKELLSFLQETEKEIGRQNRFKNGPREIDVDILFYDDVVLKTETLQIPHPLLQERDFVLIPITEIAPNFVHPVLKKTMQTLRDAL